MRVQLSKVIDAMPAISQFAQKELPAKAAYRVSKLVRKITDESRELQEQRNKAIVKHGHKVKRPGPDGKEQEVTEVRPESVEAFNTEMRALLESEIELEGVAKIKFSDLEGLHLSPAVLADLEPFLEAPVEVEA